MVLCQKSTDALNLYEQHLLYRDVPIMHIFLLRLWDERTELPDVTSGRILDLKTVQISH